MTDNNEASFFFLPPENTVCTETFFLFLSDYKITIDSFFFMVNLAHRADTASLAVSKALLAFAETDEERSELQAGIDNPNTLASQLNKFSEVTSKNIVQNTVDGFLWYVSNIVQQSMRRRPEMIKSGETVKIEEILEFSSKRELTNYLIDKKINSLSYGGLKQVQRYLQDTLGINPFREQLDNDLLRTFVEVRNIHSHNRGIVNKVFLERVSDILGKNGIRFKIGKKAHLDYDDLTDFTKCCIETALYIDQQASIKFKVKRKKLSTWRGTTKV